MATYISSGEAECWWCSAGVADNEADSDESQGCPLCDGDCCLYLGDGWCEVVYRRDERPVATPTPNGPCTVPH